MDATDFLHLFIIFFKLVMQTNCINEDDATCTPGLPCMSMAECISQLKGQQHAESKVFFRCNIRNHKVCCPIPPIKEHPTMRVLPNVNCGSVNVPKVTNGHNASFGQFPWMALLGSRLNNGSLVYSCGGTLISDQYILTAAHCLLQVNATLESVRLGEHNLDTVEDCDEYCTDPVQDYEVALTVLHEKYNGLQFKNDIGLVRLKTKVPQYTDFIKPICLPFEINVTSEEEKKYQIAGWGKTDYYDSKGSSVLQYAAVNNIPLEDCESRQAAEVRPLTNAQLCAAGNSGEDVCKGDSGGPLMEVVELPTRPTAQAFQVGIVSFGAIPCGDQISPSVYTRVSEYLRWILDHISD